MSATITASRLVASPAAAGRILTKLLLAVLRGVFAGHRSPTPALFGGPGVGKTSDVRTAVAAAGFDLREVYLNTREPEALLGCYVPDASGTSTVFPPSEFAEQTHEGLRALRRQWEQAGKVGPEPAHRPTVFFLDELSSARPETVQGAERMLLERCTANGWHFHDQVVFIVAGNLPEHGPTVSELAPTTKTRLWPILLIEPSAESWLTWARDRQLEPVVVAFVAQFPAMLYDVSAERQALTYAVPRTLEGLHYVVQLFADDSEQFALAVQGTIGERAAPAFVSFHAHGRHNPTAEQVLAHPDTIPLPSHPAALAQLAEALLSWCRRDAGRIDPLLRAVKRMPTQFQDFMVDALTFDRSQSVSPEVRDAASLSPHLMEILNGNAAALDEAETMKAPVRATGSMVS